MIIEIFLTFLAISFLLLIAGNYIKAELLIIVGFLMFVLLSFPLINQTVEFKSGEIINSTYNYDVNGTYVSSFDTITYEYEVYNDSRYYGIFLLLAGISGEFGVWYMGYRGKKEDEY